MPDIIITSNVRYGYKEAHPLAGDITFAVRDVTLSVREGSFTVILGRNGSGKSTLARLFNALLIPDEGSVQVMGKDTRDASSLWDIRRNVGMAFQNPDNQIVGTIVEEDVAFGPENLGILPGDIRIQVDAALRNTGMSPYARHSPHMLSGGQKQRVAIAGILAMKPRCMILDESTSMLDPVGRREVLTVAHRLNREEGITILLITHNMEEAVDADRVIVMHDGSIVLDGRPEEIFDHVSRMKSLGLDVPQVTDLFHQLKKAGLDLPDGIIHEDEAIEILRKVMVKYDQD